MIAVYLVTRIFKLVASDIETMKVQKHAQARRKLRMKVQNKNTDPGQDAA
jgi:hypothetical protein